MKVKITSKGTGFSSDVVNADTGEPIEGSYAFVAKGEFLNPVTEAVVFCYEGEFDIVAEATIVKVPPSLRHHAAEIVLKFENNPLVLRAFEDLLGIDFGVKVNANA